MNKSLFLTEYQTEEKKKEKNAQQVTLMTPSLPNCEELLRCQDYAVPFHVPVIFSFNLVHTSPIGRNETI